MEASPPQPKPFLRTVIIDLSIMSVIGIVLALIGPFGSFNDPLAFRVIYWLGLCYAGYLCYRPVGYLAMRLGARLDLPEWGMWIAAVLLATIPMAAFVWWIGFLYRPFQFPTLEDALETYLYVLVIGGGITVLFNVLDRPSGAGPAPAPLPTEVALQPGPDVEARFLDRLPPALGTDLIALEMEDHYVRAHTALGSELILLRMRDAVAELDGIEGLQVHRSWWVARGAVEDVMRDGRNVRLSLARGLEAPVSRANVALLKDEGWI